VPSPRKTRWALPTREERPTLFLWLIALAVYMAVGIWQPPLFLLGFWESFPFVVVAAIVIPRIAARWRR
jgi:hypothetical protein